jgi:hypothetical protein
MTETTFTAGGHEWSLRFNIVVSDRLEKIGIRAFNSVDLENILSLFHDRRKLVEALWVCVERQAKSLSVAEEDFMEFLGGAELDAAFNALVEALIVSQPEPIRPLMRQTVAEFHLSVKAACDAYVAYVDSIDLDAIIKERLDATLAKLREPSAA